MAGAGAEHDVGSPGGARAGALRVVHATRYAFEEVVAAGCALEAYLAPRGATSHQLVVRPLPARVDRARDEFGNTRARMTLAAPFGTLQVTAVSAARAIEVAPPSDADTLARLRAPSARVPALEACRAYAHDARLSPTRAGIERLVASVHHDFMFDAGAGIPREKNHRETGRRGGICDLLPASPPPRESLLCSGDPGTSLGDSVLERFVAARRGVCEDFAHFTLGCLRARGIPACYVSGYVAVPGTRGGSHAWVAAHLGAVGWVELDPTHGRVGPLGHVVVGFGRDYDDVAPLRGSLSHRGVCRMSTSVTVTTL